MFFEKLFSATSSSSSVKYLTQIVYNGLSTVQAIGFHSNVYKSMFYQKSHTLSLPLS